MICLAPFVLAALATANKVQLVVASAHALIVTDSGSVYGWGRSGNGQLGAFTSNPLVPTEVKLEGKVVSACAASDTSVFAMEDGTVKVLGSGYDGAFASGDDSRYTRFNSNGYGTQKPITVPGLKDVVQVVGTSHTYAALRRDGTVVLWGQNNYALLATVNSSGSSFVAPSVMPLGGVPKIKALASGDRAFAAIDTEGHLWIWGYNEGGMLGIGSPEDEKFPTPQKVNLDGKVVSCALGSCVGYAVLADGTLWKWGRNAWGVLGEGQDESIVLRKPKKMGSISGARKVAVGSVGRHVLVLKGDGTVLSWGNSDWGQCGTGVIATSQYEVKKIGLSGVTDIWAAGNSSFFLVGSQLYWCGSKLKEAHDNNAKPVKLDL